MQIEQTTRWLGSQNNKLNIKICGRLAELESDYQTKTQITRTNKLLKISCTTKSRLASSFIVAIGITIINQITHTI